MKTLNPRVFLREGELYAFVEKVPEEPKNICKQCLGKGWITGVERPCGSCNPGGEWRSSKTSYQRYSDLMQTAKASAIKVKNQDEVSEWLCDEYGEKILSRLEYTLEGYQMEVVDAKQYKPKLTDKGLVPVAYNTVKLAIISPVVEPKPIVGQSNAPGFHYLPQINRDASGNVTSIDWSKRGQETEIDHSTPEEKAQYKQQVDDLVSYIKGQIQPVVEQKQEPQEREWIPVSQLPTESGMYLTIRANGIYAIETWYPEHSKYLWLKCYIVTHYQPLPQPPKI